MPKMTDKFKVALAQINPTLGDFTGNSEKISSYVQRAALAGCELVVFPELAICGYPPFDLLERADVVSAQIKELKALEKRIPKNITVVLGAILPNPGKGKA